jgi:glutathione S-transferase
MITVTSYKWVPPAAQGLVRDLRPRWALEEAGIPYTEKLIGVGEDQASAWYRALQPFGQVPALEENGLKLFESGAIVLHIAVKNGTLLPKDMAGRARAIAWMFAALNSIEPSVQELVALDLFFANEEWAKMRKPMVTERVKTRLSDLAKALDGKDYLEGPFTAGDLMMTTVLRFLRHTDLVEQEPALKTYLARCEARPAFQRALTAQLASFEKMG